MPDQLRERFDALRSAVEHTDSAGLHDVRARRTRRARTRVAAATASVVAALALGGVVVLPQLNTGDGTSASGGAEALVDSDESRTAGSDAGDAVAAEPAPTESTSTDEPAPTESTSTEPVPSEQPPTEDPASEGPPFVVSADTLLTWRDIQLAGETGPGTVPYGATLVFPRLCSAENSWGQYSGPDEVVAKAWVISDGVLTQSDLQYESDQEAADALAQLSVDAQACPVVDEYSTITYVGSDSRVGEEISYFDLRVESGEDGVIRIIEIAVTRIANVLVEVVLRPDGPTVADGDDRTRALAHVAVDRVVAFG